jgi:hypothetical protein
MTLRGYCAAFGALALIAAASCGGDERPPTLPGTSGAGTSGNAGAAGTASTQAGAAGSATAGSSGAAGSAGSAGSGEPFEPECVPREPCQRLCAAVADDPTSCGLGDREQCGCICEDRFNGPCPEELEALTNCTGATPSIDCSVRGRIFAGCENESFALELCDFRAREQACAGTYPACTAYCRGATLAFCPQGPESAASCMCGCEATLVTTCASEFDAFIDCNKGDPSFTCDDTGRLQASACESQWDALNGCMNAIGTRTADAGD